MIRTDPSLLDLADRLADDLANPTADTRTGGPCPSPQSLADGAAGIALLHIERALTRATAWDTVHAWLSAAADDDLHGCPAASLYFGVPALAFATHAAVADSRRYQRALTQVDTATHELTRARLAAAHARIDRGDRPALAEFDLIRGLTGLGAYLLCRAPRTT